ncbi:MAG: alpha/beta fold hydrolase [Patescibacteria group bacterium]
MPSETILSALIGRIGVPVERRVAILGGERTSYLEAGSGDPVVLLHGGDAGAGGIRWLPVIGPLSRHFRVLAPDMPGYGESAKPRAAYDRPYFAQWLKLFMAEMGITPARLVAHSLGGAVALQYALEAPGAVRRLVLVNAAGLGQSSAKVSLPLMLRMMWNNLLPTPAASEWFLSHEVLFDPCRVGEELLEIEAYGRAVITGSGGRRVFWRGRGRAIKPFTMEQLGKITPRTLIIWGAKDRNFPLSAAQAAARVMPDAGLHVIEKAKHLCYYDEPEEFQRVLMGYLTGGS